jgi:ABC-type glycerol-3-phosphate transport system substrate-binding protein
MGTARNVNRPTDILGLLMLQNGTEMIGSDGRAAAFASTQGTQALEFYTDFANPQSRNYTWNNAQDYSIDAFFEGNAAMMITYSYHYETIKRKNEKLRFGTARVPQFAGRPSVNYANYWSYAVSSNKIIENQARGFRPVTNEIRIHEAWSLLNYMTTKQDGQLTLQNAITGATREFQLSIDPAAVYIERKKIPAARRDILETQFDDVEIGPFARGNLIAKSWYQADSNAIESILEEAISNVNFGIETPGEAIRVAENRVTALMR